jgi:hypothetical protein
MNLLKRKTAAETPAREALATGLSAISSRGKAEGSHYPAREEGAYSPPAKAHFGMAGASDPDYVVGPFGEKLTFERLPALDTTRWTIRRKAEVVAAVRGGLLTFDEACARYQLAMEELISWQGSLQRSGMPGLRTTRIQQYREQIDRRSRF